MFPSPDYRGQLRAPHKQRTLPHLAALVATGAELGTSKTHRTTRQEQNPVAAEPNAFSRAWKARDAWPGRTAATASLHRERPSACGPGRLRPTRHQERQLTLHGAAAWQPLRERGPSAHPGLRSHPQGAVGAPLTRRPQDASRPCSCSCSQSGEAPPHNTPSRPRPLSAPSGPATARRPLAHTGTATLTARAGTWQTRSPHALLVGGARCGHCARRPGTPTM